MSAAKLRGPSIVLALALMSGVLVLGQDPLVRTPPAPGPHPLQSLGRPVATATAERPGFDVLVWRRDFATLSSAEYRNAGKGTDLVLQGKADAMEALLAIDADTSPSSILLSLAADRGLALGVDGAATGLVAGVPVRVSASFYQSRDGALVKVPGGFVVSGTQIALWAERGAARESLIVSVRATFGTNREAASAVAAFGTPQLTATVQVDADGNAVASPGDTLRYQLRIPNIGDAAMTNVVANLPLDANTAAVAGSLNVSPIALDQAVTINEDTPAPITLTGSDADGNALTYTVVTQPAHGGVVQAAPGSAGVTYTPAVNFNGTDTFTVRNNDGRVDSNETATITVTVGPVNDAPSFTKGADQSVVENSPAQSVPGWATAISPGPADEIAQTITFEITNNTAPALFSVAPAVSPSGTLTYTPAPTFSGTATISIRARDSGGTGNGGVDVSPIVTFTITIRAVNEAPSFTKGADQTVLEDSGAQTVAGWATAISPGVNEITQTVTFEVTNNTNTALFAAGPAVASNGTLTFTPAANANGTATITLRARDDGGTADGGVDVSATQTFVINVTAVNDAPSFTKGADVTALEDSGANTVAGWATAISKGGGADESGQALTFVVTNNTNPALFATGPAVNAANGNLTFTPAANVFGTATITLRLDDNGGGANQSPTQTFDITVTNVNDAPSFTKGADQTVLEDAGPQTVNPWATAISAGPNEGTQTVAFAITNNTNSALFSVQPAVSPAGVLTYTPAANANGSATITLRLTDNGGTADLGVDTSATQTFVINVTAVNDNPVADDEAYGVLEGATLNVPAPGVLDGDTDVEGTTLAAQLVTGPAHASSFTLNPDGSFSYTHNGSETPLTDTFTYRASDGVLTSNLATVTITITPVNDAPIAVNDAYGVNEGATLTVPLSGVLGNDSDAEGTALTAVLVTGPAHAATFTLNPNGSFSYTHNGSETPLTDTFTYRASDGVAASNVATVTITITPVNDPPVIDLDLDNSSGATGGNYQFTFTEGQAATFLQDATDAVVTDADHTTLTSLKVTLTNRLDPGFEVLDVDLTGFPLFTKDYDITTDPLQGVLTITSATPQPIADYQTLLRRVTYSNTDLGPDSTARIVTFVANDGTSDSAAATTTITVVSLNTPPTVTAGATVGYTENQSPVVLESGLTASDPDNSSLVSATVQITGNYASGQDVLGFVDQSGITGLWNSGSGTLTLTGSALVADYQTALRTVTYVNGSDNPSTLTRTVTWIVNDGTDPSTPATSTVTVAAVNDNPVADADSYGVNEGGTLTVPAPGVLDGDTDAEGTPLTAVLVTGPAHASSFTLNPDGSFSYTHDGSETLTDTFTYRASDGALLSTVATVTIAITPINDAPVASDNAYGVNEGATLTQVAPGVLAGDTDAELNSLTAVLVTGPAHASSFTLNPDGSFSYTHDGSETPLVDTFTYRASDGVALSNLATVTITITPVNDPPAIDLDADDSSLATNGNYQFTFTEGDPATFLQDVTDATITDADHTTLTSLKVTLTNRLDPGFEVLDVDLVTGGFDANFTKAYDITTDPAQGVLTITAITPQPIASFVTLLRRVTYSNSDLGPNPANRIVTFVANDGTDNSAAATTTITVITLNNAPVAVADGYGVNEGGTLAPVAPGVLGNDTDADGDTITALLVTGPSHASSFTLNPDGSFTYVHDGHGFAADSFTYKANDGLIDSNVVTVTITVTSVNDVPSFVKGADVTVLEDSGLHTEAGWATAISAGGAEESSQVLTFNAGNNNNALFSVQPAVAADGTLTFTPAANAFGAATVTLTLSDDGGVLNGGVDTSAPQTFVITVTGVNDAPSFTKGADQTVLEDTGLHSVPVWATAISPGPLESDLLTFNVSNDNNTLFSVQPAVAANGTLTYTLAADAFGSTTVSVSLTDDGSTPGVPGDDLTTSVQTFTITVTPVNDAPSFTAGATEIVPEDTPAQTVPGWATAISVGPANESSQTFSFAVTNLSVPGSLTFTSAPAVANDGTLTYTLAPNANGTGTFNVKLTDSGGVLNGGVDSVTHVLTIDVTAVNDAPTITAGATLTFTEGNAATPIDTTITVADVDNANIASATVQITANYINGQDVLAMPVTPGIGSVFTPVTGTLTLTGSATKAAYQAALRTVTYFNNSSSPSEATRAVTWIVNDGSLPSAGATSTITVIAVNSPPSGGPDSWQTFGNTELVVDQAGPSTPFVADTTPQGFGVLSNDTDPEGDPISVVGIVTCGDVTAPFVCTTTGGGSVTMESNGHFTYTPQAGDTTADSFQYQLRDQPTAGTPATVPVTVTLNLVDRIWYVNGNVAGPGTGTSTDPFKTFATIAAADGSDLDDADDYIFVHNSTVSSGITLETGQRLFGEGHGLSINQNLNGNGVSNLVAAGASPTIDSTTGNTIAVLANATNGNETAIEIRGLTLSTSGATSNAIDVTSAGAANLGITIENVTITAATAEGIDINHASSGTATVSLSNVTVTSAGNGIDINKSGAGTLTITGFGDLHVDGNTAGSGIVVTNATFDATPGSPYNQVAAGNTTVGDSGNAVGGSGMVLTNVSGDLAFSDLDIYSGGGSGLFVTGTGGMVLPATGTLVSVAGGVATLQSTAGPVVDVTNATIVLPLASATVTSSPTTGISLDTVSDGTSAAAFSAAAGSIANTAGTAFNVNSGNATISYAGNISQTNNAAAVSVTGGHTDSLTFTGTVDATSGTGLQFSNANGTYGFNGTTTLHGGDAGIDILAGSAGTFSFGTGTAITDPSGTAFNLAASNANVTYSGSITDATGFAVDIDGHDAGSVTFQTGTLTSTGSGLRVSNSNGGTINFNSISTSLTTGANKAVTLDTNDAGGTINFNPGGGGNGLDISTTTGTGFSVLGGGTVTVQGSGNTINASAGTALDIATTALVTGGINFASTISAGAATGVRIAGVTPQTATIALGTGSLAGTFRVGDGAGTANAGGTAIITYGGSITTSAGTRTVEIQDRAAGAGNITLSGVLAHSGNGTSIFLDQNAAGTIAFTAAGDTLNSGTGTAVSLTNNTGATINFTGGSLNIDATSGGGFVATGGGTVNVTGTVNTIDTGAGTALNVANTTIGASDLTFEHISANGGTNGIVLNTTGSSGGLTVTGDGGSTNNGSGGTIQNTTSHGISLTSTRDISFDQVNISSTGGSGVNGTGVTNFTYTNGTVTNAGNSNLESALGFNATGTGVGEKLGNNLSGTLTVTGNTLTNAFYGGLDVEGDAGTITSATVSNNVITNPGFSGVNFGGSGTATTAFSLNDADIANNNITGSGGNGIQISIGNGNTGASGAGAVAHAGLVTIDGSGRPVSDPSNIISITGNSITLDAGGTQVITVANTSASAAARTQTNFEIQNNGTLASPLDGSDIGTVVLIGNNGFSDMAGVVNNNVIDPNHTSGVAGGGGNGIGGGNGTGGIPGTNYTPRLSLVVTNNDISDVNGPGILLVSRSGTAPPNSGSGKAYFKIANNTVDAPNNTGGSVREGIQVHAGNSDSLDDEVYLNIFGNTSAGSNGTVGIGLRKQGSSINVNDFAIYDAPAAPTLADPPTNAQVESFLATLNPGSANNPGGGLPLGVLIFSGSNFKRDTTLAPPLMAANGQGPGVGSALTNGADAERGLTAALKRFDSSPRPITGNLRRAFSPNPTSIGNAQLAAVDGREIVIDTTAAGWGWFVDPTPDQDEEFEAPSPTTGERIAKADGPAAGKMDLLTVLMHEIAHARGDRDLDPAAHVGDLMAATLPVGVRRGPLPALASRSIGNGAAPMPFAVSGGGAPP